MKSKYILAAIGVLLTANLIFHLSSLVGHRRVSEETRTLVVAMESRLDLLEKQMEDIQSSTAKIPVGTSLATNTQAPNESITSDVLELKEALNELQKADKSHRNDILRLHDRLNKLESAQGERDKRGKPARDAHGKAEEDRQ